MQMTFKEFINIIENNTNNTNNTEKAEFILVIGGSASGKNYIFEKNFKGIPLVDNDEITKRLSGGDFEKARKLISKATEEANKMLTKAFEKNESIGQVSTGSNFKGVLNKFIKAKSYGMKCTLVLIDTDIKKAIKRNKERAEAGKQGLIPDWKVEKTNNTARETFKELQKSEYKQYIDESKIIKN